ncbi:MAG TPA: glycosyltransferase [Candidatus Aminicenantes bacterium]|nr:glycosyltransferase [Candidatus Aminicenantes bacterium]
MKVLITNVFMDAPSGTVLYARDLALELQRQGHLPAIYTWRAGRACAGLETAGIPVVTDLRRIGFRPDVIHGHHRPLTLGALRHYPGTPALFFCHDHRSSLDRALLDPQVARYVGVSRLCVERLLAEGAPAGRTLLLPNFVDLHRFRPRPPLPDAPRRALVFSNYARTDTYLPAVTEACRRRGLALDVVGSGVGRESLLPERLLGEYDLVFAKAKAAMEAMAVGTAVVLCDFGGVGPMVTADDFDRLRPLNFGFQALTEPLTPAALERQIARYDPDDARRVSDRLRSCAGLEETVHELAALYGRVIDETGPRRPSSPAMEEWHAFRAWRCRRLGTALAGYYTWRFRLSASQPKVDRVLRRLRLARAGMRPPR